MIKVITGLLQSRNLKHVKLDENPIVAWCISRSLLENDQTDYRKSSNQGFMRMSGNLIVHVTTRSSVLHKFNRPKV